MRKGYRQSRTQHPNINMVLAQFKSMGGNTNSVKIETVNGRRIVKKRLEMHPAYSPIFVKEITDYQRRLKATLIANQ